MEDQVIIPAWLQLVLVALAAGQITEVVRHASLFEEWRARIQSRGGVLARVLNCGFCFSHWGSAAAVALLLFHYVAARWNWGAADPGLLVLLWLAATRAANLINDLSYPLSRTPREVDSFRLDE